MSSKQEILKAIVADAQPMIGWGLQRYLDENCRTQVLDWVTDTDSLLEKLETLEGLDLVIIEMALPGSRGRDGVHLIEWLQRNAACAEIPADSLFSGALEKPLKALWKPRLAPRPTATGAAEASAAILRHLPGGKRN